MASMGEIIFKTGLLNLTILRKYTILSHGKAWLLHADANKNHNPILIPYNPQMASCSC